MTSLTVDYIKLAISPLRQQKQLLQSWNSRRIGGDDYDAEYNIILLPGLLPHSVRIQLSGMQSSAAGCIRFSPCLLFVSTFLFSIFTSKNSI